MPAYPPIPDHCAVAREHRLIVRREGEALTGEWDSAKPFQLQLPLHRKDLDELAWYLER